MAFPKNILKKRPQLLIALIFLMIILHYFKISLPLENAFIKIILPIQKIFYSAASFTNSVFNFNKSQFKKNIELENEYKKVLIENIELKTKLQSIESLSEEINYLVSKKYNYAIASVSGKDSFSDSIIVLDKGSQQDVKIGYPVIASQGVYIGKIIEVQKDFSKALLISDILSQSASTFINNVGTLGITVGDRGYGMKMELIPQGEIINLNDMVVTSGLEDYIPRGLAIGKVVKISKEPNNFFQTAYIEPLISFNTLRIVSILKTY